MKKKTFIVQLLDSKNPSRKSFTQVEDANFYSNDTDASLVFIPHEDTFNFETAKVVMYNRSDESLVERDAVVTSENGRKVASYELPSEIIAHWGEWVTQPVFISGGEIYSGAIVTLSVERYLMDNRPPTLRDIIKVDELYSQLVTVMDEISGKDVISAPEIILARGEENSLGERLDKEHNEVTAQLAQTINKLESDFVNVAEFGAVGDYLLADGIPNPNATDNTQAIQEAFNNSRKVRFGAGVYYIDGTIHLPKDVVIEGNGCRLFFESGGLHLGDHIWNNVEINNITISSSRIKNPMGKGLYTEDGYIVYPKFNNVYIYGFDTGIYSKVQDVNSNFTWGNINNLRVEYCNTAIHLIGGWANTVKFKNLILNFIDKHAVLLEKIHQFHNFVINGLTMEQNSSDEVGNYSTFVFKESYNGQVTIYDGYFEANGYMKSATPEERTLYMTSGTKIEPFNKYADSKSWELNGKIYSEDTNQITKQDIGNQATFEFIDCLSPLRVNIFNTYITTDLLGIASFKNSPIYLYLDKIHLATAGHSFPNVRKIFTNSTPTDKPKITDNQLTNTGGGSAFNYDMSNVVLKGDLFGNETTNSYEKYAIAKVFENVSLPNNVTTPINYTSKSSGDLDIGFDSGKITVKESGVFFVSCSFIIGTNEPTEIQIVFENDSTNLIGTTTQVLRGNKVCSLTGAIYLDKNDSLQCKIRNGSGQTGSLIGANNNVNYLLIKKIN